MSFHPMMHGTPVPSMPIFGSETPFLSTPYTNENLLEETAKRIATLQVKLDQKLGPEYISQRQGPRGGPKLTYAEGWKIINLANEVFGFNGWSSNLVNVVTDFVDRTESGRYNVGVSAVVRVTLREGVYHEDIGYGTAENSPSKGQALDKCKKEAVTDGLKRALRNFGNLMGNCLYDKAYTQEVVKIKVPPARFNKTELHRRPEFSEDSKPQIDIANISRPPVPPFDPNTSTSSSTTTSASTSRQPNAIGNSLPSGRSSMMNARPSVNSTSHSSSSHSGTSVQPAYITSNENSRSDPSHQPQHQPQHQAQNRRVSFAETSVQGPGNTVSVSNASIQEDPTKSEPEDIFEFGDDKSFLAALGMEEGDLGRPIETDADMGPPIDHEERYLPPEGDTSLAASDASTTDGQVGNIPRNDKAARIQRLQEIMNSTNANPLNTSPPLQQSTPPEQIQNVASSSSIARTSSTMLRPLNPPHQTNQPTTHAQRNHRPLARLAANQNQNQNENSLSGSSESGASRLPTTTPSMGGFHFPPRVPRNGNVHQGQHNSRSGIGTKRSADAMSSSSDTGRGGSGINGGISGAVGGGGGGSRGSRPGMGLQQAVPQQQREPFTPLEVGESGDVKRIRR